MDDKIVKVIFEEGRDIQFDESLKQWSYGHVLQIEGLTLPDGNVEVHFSLTEYNGEAPVSIGTVKDNVITVDIPDFILAKENEYNSSYEAYAWIYVTDGESGRTIRKIVFTIDSRPKSTTNIPEDQKDPFLQEVRQVMAQTKEIAQSVREDADNGVFNGEQGPQGPPGIIEYIPCEELPTENINEKATYLVPLDEPEEDNTYAEYKYINGKWERLGGAVIKMDLSEYVKNTDIATASKLGLVIANSAYGVGVNVNGSLVISRASDVEITFKSSDNKPIVPSNLDYAVKKALSDCKLTGDDIWTDEEKTAALNLLGLPSGTGVVISDNGILKIKQVATNEAKPYSIVERSANGVIFTGEPTENAHATTKKYVDEYFSGAGTVKENKAPQYTSDGNIAVGTAKYNYEAVSKGYVDDLVGDIETSLDAIIAIQEALIGGESA